MLPMTIIQDTASAVVLITVLVAILAAAALMFKFKIMPLAMTALAADRQTEMKERGVKWYPVAASTLIYDGAMVAINSGGYAIPAADAASLKVVGIAENRADNSSGSNGDIKVTVRAPIIGRFAATSITQAMVGQMMYVVDDQTFDDAAGTNGVKAGKLVEFISTTEGWILVREAGVGAVTADADATYGQAEADLLNEVKGIVNKWL